MPKLYAVLAAWVRTGALNGIVSVGDLVSWVVAAVGISGWLLAPAWETARRKGSVRDTVQGLRGIRWLYIPILLLLGSGFVDMISGNATAQIVGQATLMSLLMLIVGLSAFRAVERA